MKDFLKQMLHKFIIIIAGITLAITIFNTIFHPDAIFKIDIFWKILIMTLLSTIPHFVYYTKKELTKKQMLIRQIIHKLLIVLLLLLFAYAWEWIDLASVAQPGMFVILVLVVCFLVDFFAFQRDKREARKLNHFLKKYKGE